MSGDITELLNEWPYDPEDNSRIITASDGRSVLQVRQPLGIEQYELDGRPDGDRPLGFATFLEAIDARLAEYRDDHGTDKGFQIDRDDCAEMHNEGILFYYRYLLLFQLHDYERVTRDTGHNLHICELLEQYCDDEEDRNAILQFKPYIMRMNAVSRAMSKMKQGSRDEARTIVTDAIAEIQGLDEIDTPAFQFERVRSVNYLNTALEEIDESEPDPAARLSAQLKEAIESEDYELAATLRDRLREL